MNSKRKASPCCCIDFGGGRVVSLDNDVLTEILMRLPVKSATRFKSVSKWWLSLLSSDHFRRLHTLRHKSPLHSLIIESFRREADVALYYINPIMKGGSEKQLINLPFPNSMMLSCSNGLILLRQKKFPSNPSYYVYNPTTKQSKRLSLAPHDNDNDDYTCLVSLHLVFDPSRSPHYKIVCILTERKWNPTAGFSYQIEVFDSETGTWRLCGEPFTISPVPMDSSFCVNCNNLVYLITRDHGYGHAHFYCFDIVKIVSQVIVCPLPLLAQDLAYSHSLQELNGCVYYSALYSSSSAAVWELQVNEDDPRQSKWLLKYQHSLNLSQHNRLGSYLLTFIAETNTVLIHVREKIMAYNFLDGSYNEFIEMKPRPAYAYHFGETETLAPL